MSFLTGVDEFHACVRAIFNALQATHEGFLAIYEIPRKVYDFFRTLLKLCMDILKLVSLLAASWVICEAFARVWELICDAHACYRYVVDNRSVIRLFMQAIYGTCANGILVAWNSLRTGCEYVFSVMLEALSRFYVPAQASCRHALSSTFHALEAMLAPGLAALIGTVGIYALCQEWTSILKTVHLSSEERVFHIGASIFYLALALTTAYLPNVWKTYQRITHFALKVIVVVAFGLIVVGGIYNFSQRYGYADWELSIFDGVYPAPALE